MNRIPLAVACVAVLGLLLSLSLASTPVQAGEDGKTLYTTYCSTCHGELGKGDGPAAAAIEPKPASFSSPGFWDDKNDVHLKKVIKEGGVSVDKSPLMAAWGAVLDDAKIDAVIAYSKTLKAE